MTNNVESKQNHLLVHVLILMKPLEKLHRFPGEMSKLTFAVLKLSNPEPSDLPVNCQTIFQNSFFLLNLIFFRKCIWCSSELFKSVLIQKKSFDTRKIFFQTGFSSSSPVWCQTRVFSEKSLHFTKRQSLLIYQTYQPTSQTDSTRGSLNSLKCFTTGKSFSSMFLRRMFFGRFFWTWLEKNCRLAAVSPIGVIHFFGNLTIGTRH